MTDLNAECERAWAAYRIAHNQAMENGQALQEARAERQSLSDRNDVLERRYHELLFAVSKKYEGEDRHETALRYIRERAADCSTESIASLTQGGKNVG